MLEILGINVNVFSLQKITPDEAAKAKEKQETDKKGSLKLMWFMIQKVKHLLCV